MYNLAVSLSFCHLRAIMCLASVENIVVYFLFYKPDMVAFEITKIRSSWWSWWSCSNILEIYLHYKHEIRS